jgi:hypothetical protein
VTESPDDPSGTSSPGGMADRITLVLGLLLIVDAVVVVVMLITDKNLQTDFGAQGNYYSHWYGALGMEVGNLLLGLAVLGSSGLVRMRMRMMVSRRTLAVAALAWSVLVTIASVAIVESYSQVGFPSAGEFAKYLFGLSTYPGALSYIPGLYDFLVAMYVVTIVVALVTVLKGRSPSAGSA